MGDERDHWSRQDPNQDGPSGQEGQPSRSPREESNANQGQTEVEDSSDSGRRTGEPDRRSDDAEEFTVVLYSDPGRTSLWVRRLLEDQGEGWSRGAELVHKQVLIPLREDSTVDLEAVQGWARDDDADISVVITEVPRMAGRRVKRTELHFRDGLAVISLPTLGPIRLRHCLRRELRRAVDALVYDSAQEAREKRATDRVFEQRDRGQSGTAGQEGGGDDPETVYSTTNPMFPGRLWLTLGMVASNEPFMSMPKLSGMFSAAAATGAFGVFFSTIWEMATFLPGWRLVVVSFIAVTLVVTWLILANRLWDRSSGVGGKKEAFMYNASTITSLLVSVSALYLLLFLGILGMALLLIDPEFMTQEIGEDAAFLNYIDIAWLSASMGVVAGAIGSNFDDDADLKNLTQGSREAQRYPRDEEQR